MSPRQDLLEGVVVYSFIGCEGGLALGDAQLIEFRTSGTLCSPNGYLFTTTESTTGTGGPS
jgi:hypothetical protein